jgi:hypothetical protein
MLKEFDLDAPTLPKEQRMAFRDQTRCVTSLFERHFEQSSVQSSAWKVLIEVVPAVTKPLARDLLGVLVFQIEADAEAMLSLKEEAKRPQALQWLLQGTLEIAKEQGWPEAPFNSAATEVERLGYMNRWNWKQRHWNTSKTIGCDIQIELTCDHALIKALFIRGKDEPVGEALLCSTRPNEFLLANLLGKACWSSESTMELHSKDGSQRWTANFPPQS